jgi:hypothetical protein
MQSLSNGELRIFRSVLECARDAEQAAQVAERRDAWEVQA